MQQSQLATRFKTLSGFAKANAPLTDAEIRHAAPSIFASNAHGSRSERYTLIPTIDVLTQLRKEGFQPFMVVQAGVRREDRLDFTKHMIRLRHQSQINGAEANEIILVNSHDGSSSYQMLGGVYRFACHNGLVCGDTAQDLRVQHRGDVVGQVIEGAYSILQDFDRVDACKGDMKALALEPGEQKAFARAALALRYEEGKTAPVTEDQVLSPHRHEDGAGNLWTTLNVLQENLVRGGLQGRNAKGNRTKTRPIQGIDQNVQLNRGLWVLAEEMRKLKAA